MKKVRNIHSMGFFPQTGDGEGERASASRPGSPSLSRPSTEVKEQ